MYQYTNDPDVLLNLETLEWIPRSNPNWPTNWLIFNTPASVPPPFELYSPEHYKAIQTAAWNWMAEFVQARRYDSVENCCSYFNSSIALKQGEARAMVAWRDAVSVALESLIQNPPPGLTQWEQIKAILPQPESFNWPSKLELPMKEPEGPIQLG